MSNQKNFREMEANSMPSPESNRFTPYGRTQTVDIREALMGLAAAVPFLAVSCTTLKNGVALSIVLFIVLLPTALLHFALRERLKVSVWLGAFLCSLVALILASLSTTVIRGIQPEIIDSLGIYIYLTAAYGVVAAVYRGRRVHSPGGALSLAFQYAMGFAFCAVVISAIRELLTNNQLWGLPVTIGFSLSGARMPFFGLILAGLILGLAQSVAQSLYARYRSVTDDE